MKVVVILDEDGHFQAADLFDRQAVVELFDDIPGGWDWVEEMVEDEEEWSCRAIVADHIWEELIGNLVQRGTLEILEL